MPNDPSPLVSVVTPVLNSARTLEQTLVSVAAQTYPNIEHIVVDGGSSDGTIDLLQRFRSPVPLRWLSGSDNGMYAAINKGIRLAKGEILSYLNGDDLYLPWSIERSVAALMATGADLVFGDLLELVEKDGTYSNILIHFYPPFNSRIYAHEIRMGQPTVFWRRKVSNTIGGFDELLRYAGDFEYWLRTAAGGFRYTHIREALAVAVAHERTLSKIHAGELEGEIEQARERHADTARARKFRQLHALAYRIHWRREVLMLRYNLKRPHPSNWPDLIRFLRSADVDLQGSSSIPLLLPLPLPRPWDIWRIDPVQLERRLIAELRRRLSMA